MKTLKITVLGSCSGTEPYPHRHQTSVAIETGGRVYFIDAGENAGYASYLGGIPQQDTAAIFITHTHMDHTGGLPHLLWNFRKLCTINQNIAAHMEGKVIQVHMPDLSVFEGVMAMLRASEGNYETVFHLDPHLVRDGVLYDQDGFKLTAFHNYHLGTPKAGLPFKSWWKPRARRCSSPGTSGTFPKLPPRWRAATWYSWRQAITLPQVCARS